ncbi:MAG: GYD domain-containing protein [Candidatus Thorarchaeota archaeon]
MPIFVIMGSLTEKGIKNIKNAPNRQKQAEDIIKSVGGKLLGLYYTFGKYDWVSIVEGPSIEAAMKALFIFGQGGTNRTRTMVAVTGEEATKIIADLP